MGSDYPPPPSNSVKFFATLKLVELIKDRTWLAKVTKALNQHWQRKNAAKKNLLAEDLSTGWRSDWFLASMIWRASASLAVRKLARLPVVVSTQ